MTVVTIITPALVIKTLLPPRSQAARSPSPGSKRPCARSAGRWRSCETLGPSRELSAGQEGRRGAPGTCPACAPMLRALTNARRLARPWKALRARSCASHGPAGPPEIQVRALAGADHGKRAVAGSAPEAAARVRAALPAPRRGWESRPARSPGAGGRVVEGKAGPLAALGDSIPSQAGLQARRWVAALPAAPTPSEREPKWTPGPAVARGRGGGEGASLGAATRHRHRQHHRFHPRNCTGPGVPPGPESRLGSGSRRRSPRRWPGRPSSAQQRPAARRGQPSGGRSSRATPRALALPSGRRRELRNPQSSRCSPVVWFAP